MRGGSCYSCVRLASIFLISERLTMHVGSLAMKKNILFDLYMYSILLRFTDSCRFVSARACLKINFFSSLLNLDY